MSSSPQSNWAPPQEARPPSYASGIRLNPVWPSHNGWYNCPDRGNLRSALSFGSGTSPLPDGWVERITPAGDTYFHHPTRKMVTTADIRIAGIADQLTQGYEKVMATLIDRGSLLDAEVYFNLGHEGALDYYFVNNATRHLFWLSDAAANGLELPSYELAAFVKSAVTGEYWTHVDYYPCHTPFDAQAESDLVDILIYYCVDDMTSPGSTSPYSAKECRQYLKLLEGFRSSGDVSDSRTATTARLWAVIARARHVNTYGLRFSDHHDILRSLHQYGFPQSQSGSRLSIGEAPDFNRSRHTLWNGRIVYQTCWGSLFASVVDERPLMGSLALVILLADVIMMMSGKTNATYTISAVLAGSSILSSFLPHQSHRGGWLTTAPDISTCILRVESILHGLGPLSLDLPLPLALTAYSAVFLAIGLVARSLENVVTVGDFLLTTAAWCFPFMPVLFLTLFF